MLYQHYDAHARVLPYVVDADKQGAANDQRLAEYISSPEFNIMGGLTRNGSEIIAKHANLRFTDSISLHSYSHDVLFYTNAGLIKTYNKSKNDEERAQNSIYKKEVHLSYYTFSAAMNIRFLPHDSKQSLISMVFRTLLDGMSYTHGGVMQNTAPLIFIAAVAKRDEPTFHNSYTFRNVNGNDIIFLNDDVLKSDNFIRKDGKILGLVLDTHQLRLNDAQNIFTHYGPKGLEDFAERYGL